jgi:hypothetical protein
METYTLILMALCATAFAAAGLYLHMLRKRSEKVYPAPFVTPAGKRGPIKRAKKRIAGLAEVARMRGFPAKRA